MTYPGDGIYARRTADILTAKRQRYMMDAQIPTADVSGTYGAWVIITAANAITVPIVLTGFDWQRGLGADDGCHTIQMRHGTGQIVFAEFSLYIDVALGNAFSQGTVPLFAGAGLGEPIPANDIIEARAKIQIVTAGTSLVGGYFAYAEIST